MDLLQPRVIASNYAYYYTCPVVPGGVSTWVERYQYTVKLCGIWQDVMNDRTATNRVNSNS